MTNTVFGCLAGSPFRWFMLLAVFAHGWAAADAAPFDDVADAVLGQPDFETNHPNYPPPGLPAADNLAFEFAAHAAIAPNGRLYISDSGNHRVLSWPSAAAFTNRQPADLVLGQTGMTTNDANHGGLGAGSFFLPQGIAVDDHGNLWVCDAFNHRVLFFHDPSTNNRFADLVIGQSNFLSNAQNLGLLEAAATADSLNFPGRVLVRGNDLWIADSGNSRVLHYTLPVGNKPSADRVFGQFDDFTAPFKNNDGSGTCANDGETPCGPPTAHNLFNAIGIAVDRRGSLFVADWINNRVLRYDNPLTSDTVADAVYGQPNFGGGHPDNGGLDRGLQMPVDLAIDAFGQLFVADSVNHRVLVYRNARRNSLPDEVFGQRGSLTTDLPNHGLGKLMTDAEGLFGPTGVTTDAAHNVYVVDAGNSRVLRFDVPIAPVIPGDFDGDFDVDLADYVLLPDCLFGPDVVPPLAACLAFDADGDGDVDLWDAGAFGRCLSGDNAPGDTTCAD